MEGTIEDMGDGRVTNKLHTIVRARSIVQSGLVRSRRLKLLSALPCMALRYSNSRAEQGYGPAD